MDYRHLLLIFFTGRMKKLDKRILDSQIEVFLEWGRRNNTISAQYQPWLSLFSRSALKTDIMDMDTSDETAFMERVYEISRTQYDIQVAGKAVRALRRFYGARGKNASTRAVMGRPPHISEIEQAKKYKKMGLRYWEMEKLTGKKISWLHRAVKYVIKDRE